LKKIPVFFVFLTLLFLIIGCTPQPPAPLKTVTVGYIAMEAASPQVLIGREQKIFEEAFTQKGYRINWVPTRGRQGVVPPMMKGEFDFLYSPANNFITYFAETSEFGGGDNYRLIAGSTERPNNTFLLVNENITTKEDLQNKVVGIANQSYIEEMMLDLQLAKAGIQLGTQDGDVRIEYQDYVHLLYERFQKGEFSAIVIRQDLKDGVLARFPNARILFALNEGEVAGNVIPHTWLKVRYDILENNPELVSLMLSTHVKATNKAIESREDLPRLAQDAMRHHREEVLKLSDPEVPDIQFIANQWRNTSPTYTPHPNFAKMVYAFLVKMNYTDKQFEQFVNFAPLETVLEELTLPPLE